MLSNLSTFLSDNCANVDLQMLIAGDPVATDIARLNHRAVSAREEEIFTEIVEKWTLNPSQMSALYGTLKQQFSLIQGPPGTGKTNTAVGVRFGYGMHDQYIFHYCAMFFPTLSP